MQTTTQTPRAPVRERSLVLSYLGLRKSVGVIGILLPIVLAVGKMILDGPLKGPGVLNSLSDYYYSMTRPIDLRDVWVGSLWALGVFFVSYRYALLDDVAGDLAGISAIGLALLPVAPAVGATAQQVQIGRVHAVLAVILLLIMAYFALVLFRKTHAHKPPTPQKLQRNRVYLVSGLIILAALALMGVVHFLPMPASVVALHPIFWLQTLAIWAFGVAWFVKGETLLKDRAAR